MGILARLRRTLTFPQEAATVYRCGECATVVFERARSCPECGGDLEEHYREPIEFYWPQT
ncbi:MAG: zinc ribbon domain-containing protein [Halobacteriota archaeon]